MRGTTFEQLVDVIANRGAKERCVTAIAGPPGAGKSTIAGRLESALNALEPQSAAVLAMDGYHLDNLVLTPRGLMDRKGAPETFDVDGFASMLARVKTNHSQEIAVPVFDRDFDIARAGAHTIPQTTRHVIVEGNYLLLDRNPWQGLVSQFDTTVAIVAEIGELRRRLEARWKGYGLSAAEVAAKVEGNDLINAQLVLNESIAAEFVMSS